MKERRGTTLIEVTAAILIAAMTSMAVFSIITSSSVSHLKSDKKEYAAAAIKMAQDRLKAYITSDLSNSFIVGPNGSWHLPGDTNGNWAFRQGNHNISSWLNGNSSFDPFCRGACVFTYNVSNSNCGFGSGPGPNFPYACKTVTFTLTYPD